LSSAIGTPILGDPALTQKSEHPLIVPPVIPHNPFLFFGDRREIIHADGETDHPDGETFSLTAKSIIQTEKRFR
jgi:hypothetical protein